VRTFRFHRSARAEFLAAIDWYVERDPIVAAAFAQVVDAAVREIAAIPVGWPTWAGRDDVRRRVLRRYPYSLVYLVEETTIIVLAVAHHKRRPGYWLRRVVSRRSEE
jgi:toxin ParE1/3/4